HSGHARNFRHDLFDLSVVVELAAQGQPATHHLCVDLALREATPAEDLAFDPVFDLDVVQRLAGTAHSGGLVDGAFGLALAVAGLLLDRHPAVLQHPSKTIAGLRPPGLAAIGIEEVHHRRARR